LNLIFSSWAFPINLFIFLFRPSHDNGSGQQLSVRKSREICWLSTLWEKRREKRKKNKKKNGIESEENWFVTLRINCT